MNILKNLFLNDINFQSIPKEYELLKSGINDKTIQKLYSEFQFNYFSFLQNKDEEYSSSYHNSVVKERLVELLKDFFIIVYHFTDIYETIQLSKMHEDNFEIKDNPQVSDVIICTEGECYIIEQINISLFKSVINKLSKKPSILDVTPYSANEEPDLKVKRAKLEINNFVSKFNLQNNKFVQCTINSIVGYIINRYYCRSIFFKDPSFFVFDDFQREKDNEISYFLFYDLFLTESISITEKMALFHEEIKKYILNDAEIHYKTFKETDFIILRDLSIRYDSLFYLVIHRESLCVLMMKKINSYDKFDHEIEFCKNCSHRCMTHFYGFVQNNDKITGFIYQFMCNGSLESYVNSNPEKINEIFCLTTINRITQAIMYLHSNSMIHRDIKPSNILLDQDFVPYLSDFDTIRHVNFDDSKKEEKNFTGNIGSFNYVSPEQYDSNNYSYPTDIYSLGLVIYFLFEKKHVLDEIKNNTFQATKCPFKINKICEQCIKINPSERPTINQVQEEVCNDIDSFNLFEQFLMLNDKKMILDFYHLIREFLVILNQENDLKKWKNLMIT